MNYTIHYVRHEVLPWWHLLWSLVNASGYWIWTLMSVQFLIQSLSGIVFCNVSYGRVTCYSFMWQLKGSEHVLKIKTLPKYIKARSESINWAIPVLLSDLAIPATSHGRAVGKRLHFCIKVLGVLDNHIPQPATEQPKWAVTAPSCLQWLIPPSPWVWQRRAQLMAPWLPMGPFKAPTVMFTLAVVGVALFMVLSSPAHC